MDTDIQNYIIQPCMGTDSEEILIAKEKMNLLHLMNREQ